jgi:hypothetical protein
MGPALFAVSLDLFNSLEKKQISFVDYHGCNEIYT